MAEEEEERAKSKDKKKVDAKKAAAEQEERLNKLVEEIGVETVLVLQKDGQDTYCQKESLLQLAHDLARGRFAQVVTDQEQEAAPEEPVLD